MPGDSPQPTQERYYTLAQVFRWQLVSELAGRAASITTHLHMRGRVPELVDLERVNRWLTRYAHRARFLSEHHRETWLRAYRGEVPAEVASHTHGCPTCGTGTACTLPCSPGDIEAQQAGRLYEPRLCQGCRDHAAAASTVAA